MGLLLRFRYLAIVVVLLLLVHSVALLVMGGIRAYEAYHLILRGPGWAGADRPGVHIVESVDALLLSLVLFVLATGVTRLFLSSPDQSADPRLPEWLRIRNFSELKYTLWEAVLVALVVASVTSFIANLDHLDWDQLILPAAILVLSVSLALLRWSGPRHGEK